MSFTKSIVESVQKSMLDMGMINPYYDRPKRGRPSKAALERRRLADEWDREHESGKYGKVGYLSALMSPATLPTGKKTTLTYIKRGTDE